MAIKIKFNANAGARNVIKTFEKAQKDQSLSDGIGLFVVDRIKKETRKGKPFNNNRKFPALKELTVKQRKRLAKFNKTHGSYSSRRSNLTFTGQLIESIEMEIIRPGLFEIGPQGKRKPYKTSPKKTAKKTPSNEELSGFMKEIGFKLLTAKGLKTDKQLLKRIKNIVRKALRRKLRTKKKT